MNNNMMCVDEFWAEFVRSGGAHGTTTYLEAFHFEMTEKLANELLALVLAGQKRATASSLRSFEVEVGRLPEVGDFSIVTDWVGTPRCVIETTAVTILPFRDIPFELCRKEGEDDSLASWRAGHRRFFIAEGRELGYAFTEELPVVFEEFKVVFQR